MNGQNRKIYSDRKQICGFQGLWMVRNWGVTGIGHRVTVEGHEDTAKLIVVKVAQVCESLYTSL